MIFNKSNYMHHNMNLIIGHNLIVLAILWPFSSAYLYSLLHNTGSTLMAPSTNPKLLSGEYVAIVPQPHK